MKRRTTTIVLMASLPVLVAGSALTLSIANGAGRPDRPATFRTDPMELASDYQIGARFTPATATDGTAIAAGDSGMTANAALIDKFDESPYYALNQQSLSVGNCVLSDGTPYEGPGTALNPFANSTDCLSQATAGSSFDVAMLGMGPEGGLSLPPAGLPGGSPTPIPSLGPVFGPTFGPGGGTGDTPPLNLPDAAVPLPAPAVLFLSGLAGVAALRRRRAARA